MKTGQKYDLKIEQGRWVSGKVLAPHVDGLNSDP